MSNYAKIAPYEAQLIADADQKIADAVIIAALRAEAQQTDWRVLSFVAIATCGITLIGLTLAGLL